MSLPIQSPPTPEQIPGYELTGEYREIQYGDEYWTSFDTLAIAGMLHPGKRWIVRKKGQQASKLPLPPKPTQAELDSETIPGYTGFECTNIYRIPKAGDVFFNPKHGVLRTDWDFRPTESPRWILRKKEPKPTLIAALPPPPQAWLDKHQVKLTGEYRPALKGELVPWMITRKTYGDFSVHGPWTMHKNTSTTVRWILAPL